MPTYLANIDALNAISVGAGGAGGHRFNIDALNAICVAMTGVGGHRFDINALNEIAQLSGGVGGHRFNIDALNEICTRIGGAVGHRFNIDALNVIATIGVNDPLAPGAITDFEWITAETDNEPDFGLNLPSGNSNAVQDAAADDHLIIEYQLQSGGGWTEYLDYTLLPADIVNDTISATGVGSVSDGSYYFRARLERGAHIGPDTSSLSVTIAAGSGVTYYTTYLSHAQY